MKSCHLQQHSWKILGGYYVKRNKSEGERHCMISLIWNLKKRKTNKTNQNSQTQRHIGGYPRGRGLGMGETSKRNHMYADDQTFGDDYCGTHTDVKS